MSIYGVKATGIGVAKNDLRLVDNAQLSADLANRIPKCRSFWLTPRMRKWWQTPVAKMLRDKYEDKFELKYGRRPRISGPIGHNDWTCLFDEFVIQEFQTSDEWIVKNTGIKSRFHASDKIATSDLAVEAITNALRMAGRNLDEVDGLFVATVSPDYNTTPPTFAVIADKLGLNCQWENGDLRYLRFNDGSAACCSWPAALECGYDAIRSGSCKLVVVVGADIMSRTNSKFSRNLYPILADGGGAIVLERTETSPDNEWYFFSNVDGRDRNLIINRCGGTACPITSEMLDNPFDQGHLMAMNGQETMRKMLRLMTPKTDTGIPGSLLGAALLHWGFKLDKLADFRGVLRHFTVGILHQANMRINEPAEEAIRELGFEGKFIDILPTTGNTTSAANATCLYEGWKNGSIVAGKPVLVIDFGGGRTGYIVSMFVDFPDRHSTEV